MIHYTLSDFTSDRIPEALELLRRAYERERKSVSVLPEYRCLQDLSAALVHFTENGMGVCAVNEGRLIGFIGAYRPFAHAYNSPTDACCWSPLHAHAAEDPDDARLWALLYQAAAEKWTLAGAKYHSVTLYRHEDTAGTVFSGYGFGWRITDSIRSLMPLGAKVPEGFTVRKLTPDDFPAIRPLRAALSIHLSRSPSFQITSEEIIERYIQSKETNDGLTIVGLLCGEALIGFLDLEDGGENFISDGDGMMNIQGMYLAPEFRGKGLAQVMLDAAVREASERGCKLIGVDYETLNPTAVGFWEKYFDPYTLTLVRRLD